MSLVSVNIRELRSFRIKHRIKELRTVIENKNTDGVFCTSNSFFRVEKKDLGFNENDIIISLYSKNIIRFLFRNYNWINIRSLLEGQIFLIKHKETNKFLDKTVIINFLKSQKFLLRLYIHNQNIYRKGKLNQLSLFLDQKEASSLNYYFFKHFIFKHLLLLLLKKLNVNTIKF